MTSEQIKQKRSLRISSYGDYIAVDIVDNRNKILSTPVYLSKGKWQEVQYKDDAGYKWCRLEWNGGEWIRMHFIKDKAGMFGDNQINIRPTDLLDEMEFKF